MSRRLALAAVIAFVATACAPAASDQSEPGTSVTPAALPIGSTVTTVAPVTTTTTTAPTTTTTTTTAMVFSTTTIPDADLTLAGDRIGGFVIGVATADDMVPAFQSFLGPPSWDRPMTGDFACPSGSDRTVAWTADVSLIYSQGVLAGYLWKNDSIPLATPEGIGIAAAVAELQEAYPDLEMVETTLGWEWFTSDGLRGFATGPAGDDFVTHIGAADLCVFR